MYISRKSTKDNIVFVNSGTGNIPVAVIKENSEFTFALVDSEDFIKGLGFYEYKDYAVYCNESLYKGSQHYVENQVARQRGLRYRKFANPKNHILYKKPEGDSFATRLIKLGERSPSFRISEGKRYTFGVEIETSSGAVPHYKLHNMKSEYDGSIKGDNGEKAWGGEYVTGVLTGDAGFMHLNKICTTLNRYTSVNKSCSVHVHIGNFPFNKDNIVFLWLLSEHLENELFSFMPASRQENAYCQKMVKNSNINVNKHDYHNSIARSYEEIVKIISLGSEPNQIVNKKLNHPAGRNCGWNKSTPRYWWVNFVPTLFSISGIEGHTIELRLHSATTNFIKMRNFILLCMAMVSFVENNKNDIIDKNFDVSAVLKEAFKNKGDYLSNYYKERKEFFSGSKKATNERVEYVPISFDNIEDKSSFKTIL